MSKRFLLPGRDSVGNPAIYHCISRGVDRRFVLGDDGREQFRMFMRMQENLTGWRVVLRDRQIAAVGIGAGSGYNEEA